MKCYVPDCNKEIPKWRMKRGRITCSKKCVNAWNWTPYKLREKIRGKKYGRNNRKRKTEKI